MTLDDLKAAAGLANVQAFLRMIRVGEGTEDEGGYARLFGGGSIDTFASHPNKAVTKTLGGRSITSTAAGAYQFLFSTWQNLARQYGFTDFSPPNQDLGAIALIAGRKALDDVIAGRIQQAIAKCSREWASLPGSPYGQPTVTMAKALEAYAGYGGTLTESEPVAYKEAPMLPFVATALPALIDAVPALVKAIGSNDPAEVKNEKAVQIAMDVAKQAVNATNEQDLVTKMTNDPQAVGAVQEAIKAAWHDITEAGGGGIDGARKADQAFVASGKQAWQSPAFLISCLLLVMPFGLLADVFYAHPTSYDGNLRTQIVTAVLLIIGMVGGYWIGSSFGSDKKTDAMVR